MSGLLSAVALGALCLAQEPGIVAVPAPGSTTDVAVQSRMLEAARKAGERTPGVAVSLSPTRCPDQACVAGLLEAPGSDAVIQVRVTADGRDYSYALLLETAGGETLIAEDTCEVCGLEEAAALLEDSAVKLLERYQRSTAPGTISLGSNPSGVEVLADGSPVGATPLALELSPGSHTLELRLPGYESQRRTLTLGPGESLALTIPMTELPPPPPPWRPLAIVGGVGIGAGAVAVGVGAALVAIDERPVNCSANEENAFGVCPRRYASLEGGAAALAVGGALLVTGIVLEVVSARRRRAQRVAAHRFSAGVIRF